MRGTPFRGFRRHVEAGIIPAYAGNTVLTAMALSTIWDHPRVCGEHIEYKVDGATSQGSSPRMRGTRGTPRKAVRWSGIIPAYAGNTKTTTQEVIEMRDHPRVCGEHPYA